ncbi:MAG: hypothetical protein K0R99_930 [Microbacterium sp.]|jgi:S-DNA-T family DNA segregation ATPase FtsK/SpoIIIE|uniref:type IV secretory system conjugative DNA transfer family protein n=1 Tax=Microbacterium sp. TaxID=51671 RepID=UPI00260386C4|nr:FtsK/SpoIIIE domain-containing protein [Microbacterium sp.]MDF2559484.1 hypothetical protein [Microbacterium sp.]
METINSIGIEFFEKNPAITPRYIPLAVKENGQTWGIGLDGHTLFAGMTGSGKSSAIDGTIRQLAPFIESGVVKLYGIDPKEQLRFYGLSRLFTTLAGGAFAADTFDTIAEVHAEMKRRLSEKRIDLDSGDLGRTHGASEDSPATVLLIDEFDSLLYLLRDAGREAATAERQIKEILTIGRSAGVSVVATAQSLSKDVMGRALDSFHTVALFRQRGIYFNDVVLGEGAAERGFDSTKIPAANMGNNYAGAGIAYATDHSSDPAKVRFAYSSKEDIAALIREYIKN